MGILDFLRGKKKTKYKQVYEVQVDYVDDMVVDEEPIRREEFFDLEQQDRREYLESLQEGIRDLKNSNVQLKEEYKAVSSYLSDIQLIETLPEPEHSKLVGLAKNIQTLSIDRKIYQTTDSKISQERYISIQKNESEIKQAIVDMQNNEKRLQMIKNDLKMLDAEKFGLRQDGKALLRSQELVNKVTLLSFLTLLTVFVIYIIMGMVKPEQVNDMIFLGIIFGVLVLVAVVFAVAHRIKYNVKLTELKINKAIALHNKVKIKYVNTSNMLSYQQTKYDVETAYQLGRLYELYLETKKENEMYMRTTGELNASVDKLMEMLRGLNLYDPMVWQNEIRALIDKREMVEVRHRLNQRRQKIREKLSENENKISQLEFNVKLYTISSS